MTIEPPRNVTEAFLAGLHGAGFISVNSSSVVVHIGEQPRGPILALFERLSRWPASELIDDRDAAYRVGRALRISARYLDELGVPVEGGKDLLEDVVRVGNQHIRMHGGCHTFGPSHVIEAFANNLGPWGEHRDILLHADVNPDRLREAIWSYVRGNDNVVPLAG